MITTVGFGDAVSRWTAIMSLSRWEDRTLFAPILRLASGFATGFATSGFETGDTNCSKLSTSYKQIWCMFNMIRNLPRKSLSASTVTGFDADLLICAAERFDLHVGNQFPETHGIAANALFDEGWFICYRPFSVLQTRFWATSSHRTTPVAILRRASESWVKGSDFKPEEKLPIIFLTSFLVSFNSPRSCFLVRCFFAILEPVYGLQSWSNGCLLMHS